MAAPETYSLAHGPITAHAFNRDRSRKRRFIFGEEDQLAHRWIRGRGQLEFQRRGDFLKGQERLERYRGFI